MKEIIKLTIKGVVKDRIFIVILCGLLLYFAVPVFGMLSMKNVAEISVTLSLTLNSFLLLLLSILGGVSTIWRDIEKKQLYTLLSTPITRNDYLLGRFSGFTIIMASIAALNLAITIIVSLIAIKYGGMETKFSLFNLMWAFLFSFMKFTLVLAFCFFFSTFSSSFFLPFFATIVIYLLGNASQGIYDAIFLTKEIDYPEYFKFMIKFLHFILPNLSSFDLTVYASYGINIELKRLVYPMIYFAVYLSLLIISSLIIFNKKNVQ